MISPIGVNNDHAEPDKKCQHDETNDLDNGIRLEAALFSQLTYGRRDGQRQLRRERTPIP